MTHLFHSYFPKRNESMCLYKDLYINVYNSLRVVKKKKTENKNLERPKCPHLKWNTTVENITQAISQLNPKIILISERSNIIMSTLYDSICTKL